MLSAAEMFLLVWALGATFAAVLFQHRMTRARGSALIAHMMLVGLANGTARFKKVGNATIFTNSDEEADSEIRIEARQG